MSRKNLVDRIFQSWKSSILGLLIILLAAAAVFMDKASLTEGGAVIAMGIGLFFINDKPRSDEGG